MTFSPISGILPQFSKDSDGTAAAGYYIKLFTAGTTTAIPMATDTTGSVLLSECELSLEGYPRTTVSDTANFIPHSDRDYKISLYANLADAVADQNAVWTIDNVPQIATSDELTDLELDLANSADPLKGSGQIGHLITGLLGVTDFESEVSTELNRLTNRVI